MPKRHQPWQHGLNVAVASAIARLVTYISVSAAAIRLRLQMSGDAVRPALS
jgi:hypothetical protein